VVECCRSVLGDFVAREASGRRLGTLGGVVHVSIDVEYGPLERTLLNLLKSRLHVPSHLILSSLNGVVSGNPVRDGR
jgi:hypothetical protein